MSVTGVDVIIAEVIMAINKFNNITEPQKIVYHAGIASFFASISNNVSGKTIVNHYTRKRLNAFFI